MFICRLGSLLRVSILTLVHSFFGYYIPNTIRRSDSSWVSRLILETETSRAAGFWERRPLLETLIAHH